MASAKGKFEVASWNEETYRELGAEGKLTRASVTQTFSGDIVGEGAVEWLMCYLPDGSARFVGLQHVSGSLGDKTGSFVFESIGDFDGKEARGVWTVVAGSGTGEFEKLRGEGRFVAPHGPNASYEFSYDLP